ncbi:hypothetical protein [Chryseobacterium sp. JUb7]|uniref:hypothetical protein n=1 Tax=Chryseobacterium sp. JUb7 TaxID=2940599 RepID=UPI002166FBFA|nr:hypothetical protein [Chryseobacterium sp. JUb7]MCS3529906.1 DNA-binding CsgD family transcriptional regulator [Chryseobacterium sp. JUb7]
MFRTLIYIFIALSSIYSCHAKNDNEYFYGIDKEITPINHNKEKLKSLYRREFDKYKKTHELKYLLSSKYVENSLYSDDKLKKISIIYEMLRINDDEYTYITVACNFFLGLELETTSPKLSLQFLNEAIKIEEKEPTNMFLPHIYHMKGRWYLNHGNYSVAKQYFNRALQSFKKEDKLYIASMHNNFGLCDFNMGDIDRAIEETRYGIKILESVKNLTEEELFFLYDMKGNLGDYYVSKKNFPDAERYLNIEIEFYKTRDKYSLNVIQNLSTLINLYRIWGNKKMEDEKEKEIIHTILAIYPKLNITTQKIMACAILQKYYSKTNDLENLKKYSNELLILNKKRNKEIIKDLDNVSDILNGYIIKNINQEYDYQIEYQRRKSIFLIVLVMVLVVIFARALLNIRKKNREEKYKLETQNIILENNKEDLEKNIEMHRGKIENLHLNLNLKMETEKAFLEHLKKIKKSKNIDAEETVKDLFFKINNLLQIDEKNHNLMNESSVENDKFMKKLSGMFSGLTEHEVKLCVYFRLNLSSKEISLLENITPGSVRVYKTKVKSKMKLSREEDLSVFLNSIK